MSSIIQSITTSHRRIESIDMLRGLAMLIMVLDHVRDFFYPNAFTISPTDLTTTTSLLFFTRWITHFCAPIFILLAGTAAYLFGIKKTKNEISLFLITRGIWLIIVELTILTLAWTFNPSYNLLILQVVSTIGVSMIFLGCLVHLPYKVLLIIGLLIVGGHNLFDNIKNTEDLWWKLIYGSTSFSQLTETRNILIIYSFFPWTGVMVLGYCLGKIFEKCYDVKFRQKFLYSCGSFLIGLFIVLRLINGYGEPESWFIQRDGFFSFLSFINTTKYPPSLMFLCMTIGPALLLLSFLEGVTNKSMQILNVFGKVPLFFYICHFYLIHILCMIAFFLSGHSWQEGVAPNMPFFFRPLDFGFSLLTIYSIWILVIVLLYPICLWYKNYKDNHYQWWLSYL